MYFSPKIGKLITPVLAGLAVSCLCPCSSVLDLKPWCHEMYMPFSVDFSKGEDSQVPD